MRIHCLFISMGLMVCFLILSLGCSSGQKDHDAGSEGKDDTNFSVASVKLKWSKNEIQELRKSCSRKDALSCQEYAKLLVELERNEIAIDAAYRFCQLAGYETCPFSGKIAQKIEEKKFFDNFKELWIKALYPDNQKLLEPYNEFVRNYPLFEAQIWDADCIRCSKQKSEKILLDKYHRVRGKNAFCRHIWLPSETKGLGICMLGNGKDAVRIYIGS